MDRYVVISADGHAGPPASVYRDYLDPGFRDRFDEHQRMMTELRAAMGNNDSTFREEWEAETDGDGGLTAAFDSDARNAVLDTEGVVAEVLFPDADVLGTGRIAASPFGTGLAGAADNADEAIAGSRAHNRWLADFVRAEPERRIGVAVIPAIIPDMDTVLGLVREAKDLGHRGILIPTRWFDRPAYHDPWYEPLWTLTEELGLVLHTHSGRGPERHRPRPGHAADLRVGSRLVGGAPARGVDLGRHLRTPPGPQVLDGRERGVVGPRPDPQDGREVDRRPQHPQVRQRVP